MEVLSQLRAGDLLFEALAGYDIFNHPLAVVLLGEGLGLLSYLADHECGLVFLAVEDGAIHYL